MPTIELNKVVFPDPFGPINPTILPFSTDMEISTLAFTPPKDLLTLLTSKILILSLPEPFDQLRQLLLQIYEDIFLSTIPLILHEGLMGWLREKYPHRFGEVVDEADRKAQVEIK